MQIVPIEAVPSQVVSVSLGGQACSLNVYQKSTGVYMDVYVNESLIIGGVICENKNRIVHSTYLGFVGDLAFFDTQGTDDPDYSGMGDRWILLYLDESDIVWPPTALSDTPAFTPLPIPPTAPTGFTVAPAFEQNVLTWDTVAGMTYNAYYAESPGVTTSNSTKISGITPGYIHAGLADNTRYYYVLEVNDAYGNSALSSEVSGLTLPGAPAGLTVTDGSANDVTISMTQIAGLTYNVYYSTVPDVTPSTGTKITGLLSPYDLPNLFYSTEYYFVATAVNATGEGPACAQVSVTTNALPPATDKVLLHFDGVNGATTTTDAYGNTVTLQGGASLSTTEAAFGASSLNTPAGSNADVSGLTVDPALGWTLECWVYATTAFSGGPFALGNLSGYGAQLVFSAGSGNTYVMMCLSSNGTTWDLSLNQLQTSPAVSLNAWHHFALTFDQSAGHYYSYVDGVKLHDLASSTPICATSGLKVGSETANNNIPGYVDEFRLSDVCRYPGGTTFTPTGPFTS